MRKKGGNQLGVVGSLRTCTDPEFLKDQPGDKTVSIVFDDCDLDTWAVKVLKAAADVQQAEAKLKVRYTAASFVQGQSRQFTDNKGDFSEEFLEENGVRRARTDAPTEDEFFKMVRPAFAASATKADIRAILKRACFVVNSDEYVYIRPAGLLGVDADVQVQRIPIRGRQYITPEAKAKFKAWAEDGWMPDANALEADLLQEFTYIDKAFKKKSVEVLSGKSSSLPPAIVLRPAEPSSPARPPLFNAAPAEELMDDALHVQPDAQGQYYLQLCVCVCGSLGAFSCFETVARVFASASQNTGKAPTAQAPPLLVPPCKEPASIT